MNEVLVEKICLNLETNADIKVFSTFKDYHILLNKRTWYLHKQPQDFNFEWLATINKDRSKCRFIILFYSM